MKLSGIMEALVRAGATADMLIAAVKAYEEEQEKISEGRRAKDRERQRRHRMSRDVTVTNGDGCDTPPNGSNGFLSNSLSLNSLSPPKENPPYGGQKKSPQFDDWWQAYPHKVGKGAAVKAYPRALAKTTPEELLEGLQRYVAAKPAEREYCNPATWLNQERWKDEPAEIALSPRINGSHAPPLSFEELAQADYEARMAKKLAELRAKEAAEENESY